MKTLIAILSTVAFMASAHADSKSTYDSIKGAAISISFTDLDGNMILGVSTTEKQNETTVCQKVGAVVPNPKYSYACYNVLQTSSAEAIYNALNVEALNVIAHPTLIGAGEIEKRDGNIFCREFTPVTPNPAKSYTCYVR